MFPASFPLMLALWHDFSVVAGTAAATLLGLLFVALSLHNGADAQTDLTRERGVWSVGGVALLGFVDILTVTLIFLIPQPTTMTVGLPLIILGVGAGIAAVSSLPRVQVLEDLRARALSVVLPLCFLSQAIIGGFILTNHPESIGWLALLQIILLLSTILTAWVVLAVPILGKMRQERQGNR